MVECTLAKSDNSISMKTHISSVPLFNVCLRENNLLEAAKANLLTFAGFVQDCLRIMKPDLIFERKQQILPWAGRARGRY